METNAAGRFVSTYRLRIDAKGRLSIPAPYRALIARDGLDHIFCHPGLEVPALEAGGLRLLAAIDSLVALYPPGSSARAELATALYGASETLKLDPEGRVMLGEELKAHAGLSDSAILVGLGESFRIWEPGRFRAHLAEATARVRALRTAPGDRGATQDIGGTRG